MVSLVRHCNTRFFCAVIASFVISVNISILLHRHRYRDCGQTPLARNVAAKNESANFFNTVKQQPVIDALSSECKQYLTIRAAPSKTAAALTAVAPPAKSGMVLAIIATLPAAAA